MQEAGVQPDKAACNILIEKFSKLGDTWAINQVLLYMKENYLVLRYPVYLSALEALRAADESDDLLHQVNPHISIKDDTDNANTQLDVTCAIDRGLILNFLKKKNFYAIDYLVAQSDESVKLDTDAISTIIKSSCAHGKVDTCLSAFDYSLKTGVAVDEAAYSSLIGICIRIQEFPKAIQIVDEMAKAGVSLETEVACLLIYRLGGFKQLDYALKVFDSIPKEQKNTATYTAIVVACLSCKNAEKAIEIFRRMKSEGVCVGLGTYNALISGLEKCGRHDVAKVFLQEKKRVQATNCCLEAEEGSLCDLLFAGLYVL